MVLSLCDSEGKVIREIDSNLKPQGTHAYRINTETLPPGMYYVVMKTHESDNFIKVLVQ
jgi:biotin synthase-like enzyme